MSVSLGLDRIHPSAAADRPHILRYSTTRTTSDDGVMEIRAGSASGTRVLRINKDGQIQGANGTVLLPTYSLESDKDSGLYRIGADNLGLSLGGTKRWDFATGGSTLTGTLTVSGAVTLQSTLAVTGAVTLTVPLAAAQGGTGSASYTTGDLPYASGATTISKLAIGAANRVLTSTGSAPQWVESLTLGGTLAVTGVSTLTGDIVAGQIVRRSGTNDLLSLLGGAGADVANGAWLTLFGTTHGTFPGQAHYQVGTGGQHRFFSADGTERINISATGAITITGLPTSNPGVTGQLWNDGGTVKISA